MSEVDRYEMRIVSRYSGDGEGDIETDASMKREPKERYVLFSDYDQLRAELAALKAGPMDAGIELAARWVEQRANDYDTEHGSTDPETGCREYPGDGAEYYGELMEIAEGIRALLAQQQEVKS